MLLVLKYGRLSMRRWLHNALIIHFVHFVANQLYTKETSKNWKLAGSDGSSQLTIKEPSANVVLLDFISSEKWEDVVDFDDHLDDISKYNTQSPSHFQSWMSLKLNLCFKLKNFAGIGWTQTSSSRDLLEGIGWTMEPCAFQGLRILLDVLLLGNRRILSH